MEVNREELAWAAGFFDGEGNAGWKQRPRQIAIYLQIGLTEKQPLLRFQRAVGGIGNVGGPYGPYHTNCKQVWAYRVSNFEHVQAITAMLWDFLCETKRSQLKTAIQEYLEMYHVRCDNRAAERARKIAEKQPRCVV